MYVPKYLRHYTIVFQKLSDRIHTCMHDNSSYKFVHSIYINKNHTILMGGQN